MTNIITVAANVNAALTLSAALQDVTKFSAVEDMEVDMYPHAAIADVWLTNGHHIRVPFSIHMDPQNIGRRTLTHGKSRRSNLGEPYSEILACVQKHRRTV